MLDPRPEQEPPARPRRRPTTAARSLAVSAAVLAIVAGARLAYSPAPGAPRADPVASPPTRSPVEDGLAATIRSLESMGSRSTHEKQWEAARWIAGRLVALGLETETRGYEHEGRSWPNVLASMRGTSLPEERVLVIAHLDSISPAKPGEAPGADDDGSGVAVLLDVARRLAGRSPARTIDFVVFSEEEQGRAGSRSFARAARASGARIEAVLNLDTLGYSASSGMDWAGLRAIGSTRAAAGALKTMLANRVRRLWDRRSELEVVGRPAHADLVRRVAARLGQEVRVRGVVKEDCG